MKTQALTIWQPHATLVALGFKRIETRSWCPVSSVLRHGEVLAIHAGARWTRELNALCFKREIRNRLEAAGYTAEQTTARWSLPLGCVVALAHYAGASTTESILENPPPDFYLGADLCGGDHDYGNYDPGRFVWMLRNIWRLSEPIPAKGAQGLWQWECPDDVWAQYQEVSQ